MMKGSGNFVSSAKHGFQRFCTGTSCHGFNELYMAKSLFWKIFWVIVCGGAFGVTIYQIYECLDQYMHQTTNTVVVATEDNQILYPPLKLCYWHWLYWVDFDKAMSLKISKGALFFSFNYYTRIFSRVDYNVDEEEQKLIIFMAENNFSSVFEFHRSIARSVPIISDNVTTPNNNISGYFTDAEIMFRDPGFLFCYVIPSDQLHKYFAEHKPDEDSEAKKLLTFYTSNENYDYNHNNLTDFIQYSEYNSYMLRWIEHKTKYSISEEQKKKNYSAFAPPVLLFPNGLDSDNLVAVVSETDQYNINLKGSACQWQDLPKTPCTTGERSVADNNSCKFVCTAKTLKTNCSCIRYHYAVFMKDDKPNRVCRDEFYTLPEDGLEYLATLHTPNKTVYSQICNLDNSSYNSFKSCLHQCSKPCEVWTYDVSVLFSTQPSFIRTIGEKHVTNIVIQYPMGTDILIMIESNAQSWEVFVGNVGGLLGIWTGASIVSFIQLFYLFCCAESEGINVDTSWVKSMVKRNKNPVMIKSLHSSATTAHFINNHKPLSGVIHGVHPPPIEVHQPTLPEETVPDEHFYK